MKIIKRLFLIIMALVVLLIGALIAIPYFFKDELLAVLKDEINKNVLAKVDFADVDLSLIRSFPDFSLQIKDYVVEGIEEFEGIKLASGETAGLTLDLMSVIKGETPLKIKSIALASPEVNVYVLKNGKANYDIAVPSESTNQESIRDSSTANFVAQLEQYQITDASILYDDKNTDTYLKIDKLDHEGSGRFTLDVYDLNTKTNIEAITVSQAGITYLNKAKATLDAIFNIDQKNAKYTLKDNNLKINALKLVADGFVQLIGDDIAMDLKVNTPQNEFKNLLSMIPNAYIQGYENVKANGKFTLDATIKGTYKFSPEQYPGFTINLGVDNADIQYPDLPLGISNINTDLKINSPGSNLDQMKIDVPRLNVKIGNNPFNAKFKLRTPISDPDVDATVNGVINLEELAQAFPMEGIEKMNGIITADMTTKAKMSQIDRKDYENVDMSGDLKVENVNYQSAGLPPVLVKDMQMTFNPKNVTLSNFDAQLGKSDVQASGTIDNILAYFSPEKTMEGKLKVRSKYFDANEWMATTETTAPTPSTSETPPASSSAETEIFDRFDFTVDAVVDKIVYENYELKNSVVKGNMTPNKLQLDQLGTVIGNSDIAASGVVNDAFDYLFDNGVLSGNVNLRSRLLDLNQFMVATETTTTSSTPTSSGTENLEPIVVPANIALAINADIGKVLYTNMELNELKGNLLIENQSVVLDNTTMKTLGGNIDVSGGYDSSDPENPEFSLKYDLKSLNFGQAFNTLNTFQQLAPVGKFINGNLNSSLILSGVLGKDLMPKLNTLNAEGFLQTLDGVISNFKPLQAIGNSLNVEELKETIPIKNSKNWFAVKNGVVEVKEFDLPVKEIDMKIGGTHGLNTEMDYNIAAKIPRALLEKNAVGAAASSGFDALSKEASKLGLDLKKSEFVNVGIKLTGSLTDPKVKVKLLGTDGEASLADSAKETAKAELDKQKEKLAAEVDKEIAKGEKIVDEKVDELTDKAKTEADKVVNQATDKAKEKVGEELGKAVDSTLNKKAEEVLGDQAKESIDDIKDNLEKFNPFKKKKKDKDKDKGGGN